MKITHKQFKQFIFTFFISVGAFFVAHIFFNTQQSALLALITMFITLWTNELLALGVVSLLPIVLFPAFGILDTKATALNYAHPIIYLFFGGFLLAIAVEKTQLHKVIAAKILAWFPSTPRGILFSLAITSALLSSLLSNTTTTLLLISIALFLTDERKLQMRFALAIAYGASIGGILTPIGTPPNLILLGIMEEHEMEMIPFFQWIVMTLPLVLVMLVSMSMILSLGLKNIVLPREEELHTVTSEQKKVLSLLGMMIFLLLVNAPIKPYWNGLGLSESGLLLGFGLLLFTPVMNILQWEEDAKKIPYAVMFLFGAGFSIAKAFSQTGLADEVASYLLSLTTLTPFLMLLVIAILVTFTTEITSNTALISILLPILYSVGVHAKMDVTLLMMVATICASYAFMLPIATPPNAIAMGAKAVHVKDMIRYGIVLNILGIMFIVLIASLFWRYMI